MTPVFPPRRPAFGRPFQRSILLLLLVAMLGAAGCTRVKGWFKDSDANEGVPVAELFQKGHTEMEHGNWISGITVYKRLIAQYPYGDYTEQAMVETARPPLFSCYFAFVIAQL